MVADKILSDAVNYKNDNLKLNKKKCFMDVFKSLYFIYNKDLNLNQMLSLFLYYFYQFLFNNKKCYSEIFETYFF